MKLAGLILISALASAFAQPGAIDLSFNPGTGASYAGDAGVIMAICLQSNGQILIGGNFGTFEGSSQHEVARLNPDGSLDSNFNKGSGPNGVVNYIANGTNGATWIAGNFSEINGAYQTGIARLRSDGSFDATFQNSVYGQLWALTSTPVGDAYLGGDFTSVSGTPEQHIVRFLASGGIDAAFNASVFTNDGATTIRAIGVQPDGGVIVAGDFMSVGGHPYQLIARLLTNGVVDTNFIGPGLIAGGTEILTAVSVLPNGKIIIAGGFTSINGYSERGIARLNCDGTLDNSFQSVAGGGPIAAQADGKVLTYANSQYPIRLNLDGSLDASFSASVDDYVETIAIQTDGRILIGGTFSMVDGMACNSIARLIGNPISQPTVQLLNPALYAGMFVSGSIGTSYQVEYTTNLSSAAVWMPLVTVTLTNGSPFVSDPTLPQGSRFYRAVSLP